MSKEITTTDDLEFNVTEQEIDKYIKATRKRDNPVSRFAEEDAEIEEITKRISAGEEVSRDEIKAAKEKIERREVRHMLENAKAQPFLNETMGQVEKNRLMDIVRCKQLAAHSKKDMKFKTPLEEMLTDQFIACHKLSLHIFANIYDKREGQYGITDDAQLRLVNTSVKLMDASQKAALAINKLQTGGQQTVVVKHQYVQVNDGGQAVVTNDLVSGGGENEGK